MKAVILSCNTGGGHNAAAQAVRQAMVLRGHEALVLDYLALAGPKVSRAVGGGYVGLVQHSPKAFGAVYGLGRKVSGMVDRSPIYYANSAMAKYLREYFSEHPVDVILTTHLYAAETLTWMRRHGETLPPTIAIATDYTCIPFWGETDCDFCVIPHEDLTDEFVSKGVPREKIYPLGIPVAPEYSVPLDKQEARKALGLDPGKTIYLIMGGSMGYGNIDKTILQLDDLPFDFQAMVVCGSNLQMRTKLKKLKTKKRFDIYGFSYNSPMMMDACDVMITKPGGISLSEGLAKRVPMVLANAIPGMEDRNSSFMVGYGLALAVSKIYPITQAVTDLLTMEGLAERMSENQKEFAHPDSTAVLCDFVIEKGREFVQAKEAERESALNH